MNFENLTVDLHVFIISFGLAKFQEDQNSYVINQILNFKFLWYKIMHKNKFIDRIVNNIRFEQNLTCVLRTWRTCNPTIRFSKFTSNKKI